MYSPGESSSIIKLGPVELSSDVPLSRGISGQKVGLHWVSLTRSHLYSLVEASTGKEWYYIR